MIASNSERNRPSSAQTSSAKLSRVLRCRSVPTPIRDHFGALPNPVTSCSQIYSRRQLETVARLRELFDKGHTLSAAARILGLENDLAATKHDLAAAQNEISDLRAQLARATDQDAG